MNSKRLRLPLFVLLAVASLPPTWAASAASKPELLVYAAASLTNALDDLGRQYQSSHHQPIKFSFAASSTLARQIEAGAPADVFISADNDWADYLQARNLIKPATRKNVLGNHLVLIAPASSSVHITLDAHNPASAVATQLVTALGQERLSIADPDSVPAGKYARAALLSLNAWHVVADKLVLGDSVRTTLNFVSQGASPLGIVYTTDALIAKNVRIVDTFPDSTHAPIVYPFSLTTTARAGADEFMTFLSSPEAATTFKKYGFVVLP